MAERLPALVLADSIIEFCENSGTTFNEQITALRVVLDVLPVLESSLPGPSDSIPSVIK